MPEDAPPQVGLQFGVVTLFPEMLAALTDWGVTGRAFAEGRCGLTAVNPREFANDRHGTVDDRPYGGGPGMVMKAPVLAAAVGALRERMGCAAPVVMLSPQGQRFDAALAAELAAMPALVLVAGRYEGIDERFVATAVDREISVGDYVVSGGELPAMLVMDAVIRLLPGVLGHADSAAEDSHAAGLLDCPHYTRPEEYAGLRVPGVLLSGDHGAVARWRRAQALWRTLARRPDMLAEAQLTPEDRALLEEWPPEQQ